MGQEWVVIGFNPLFGDNKEELLSLAGLCSPLASFKHSMIKLWFVGFTLFTRSTSLEEEVKRKHRYERINIAIRDCFHYKASIRLRL